VLAQDVGASPSLERIKEECAHCESAGPQSCALKVGTCSEGRAIESTKVAVPAAACDRAPLFLNSPTMLDKTANLILYSTL